MKAKATKSVHALVATERSPILGEVIDCEKYSTIKIALPRFSGDIMKWTTFWDSYKSAVHSNDELSDVDKFNYLKSLLERTAYEAIAGLTLSSANYAEAVDILEKRFGNKQLIISKHMETLLNMDVVTSD
jgi:hypothetical protein